MIVGCLNARRTDRRMGKATIVTIYAVTSHPPGRIAFAQLAALIRGRPPQPDHRSGPPDRWTNIAAIDHYRSHPADGLVEHQNQSLIRSEP